MAKRRTSDPQLLALARRGAEVRIQELEAEIDELVRTFKIMGGVDDVPQPRSWTRPSAPLWVRPGRTMSVAQRKAVGARMKEYWAQRRKAGGNAK